MNLEQKLKRNIEVAKQFGKNVYLCYCNNNLVASYACNTTDQAYNKMKFNFPETYPFIEVMKLSNQTTINSPAVYEIVKELFGKTFTAELEKQ